MPRCVLSTPSIRRIWAFPRERLRLSQRGRRTRRKIGPITPRATSERCPHGRYWGGTRGAALEEHDVMFRTTRHETALPVQAVVWFFFGETPRTHFGRGSREEKFPEECRAQQGPRDAVSLEVLALLLRHQEARRESMKSKVVQGLLIKQQE